MFEYLKQTSPILFRRYQTIEKNIAAGSNSFFDSVLSFLEDLATQIYIAQGIDIDASHETFIGILRTPAFQSYCTGIGLSPVDLNALFDIGKTVNEHKHENEKTADLATINRFMRTIHKFCISYFSSEFHVAHEDYDEGYYGQIYDGAGAAGTETEQSEQIKKLTREVEDLRQRIMTMSQDFVVKDGILVDYFGRGGTIVIPEGVRIIGREAFSHLQNERDRRKWDKLILPDSLEQIRKRALSGLLIDQLLIPPHVYWIDKRAFESVTLKRVFFANKMTELPHGVFKDCKLVEAILPDTLKEIPDGLFCGQKELKKVSFPSSIVSIGDSAFSGCSSLSKLPPLGNQLKNIGPNAFSECCSLKSIDIPMTVETIGRAAFRGCEKLEELRLPAIKNIPDCLCEECRSLSKIVFSDGVTSIGHSAFAWCALREFSIPESVKEIGYQAFAGNRFSKAVIHRGLVSLGLEVFKSCDNLETVTLPNTLKKVDYIGCFRNFSFELPWDCDRHGYDFRYSQYTSHCISVFCEATSKPDGWSLYWDNGSCGLDVYWGIKYDGFTVESDGFVFKENCDGTATLLYQKLESKVVSIPEHLHYEGRDIPVTVIGSRAFNECQILKKVSLPSGIKVIGHCAFGYCENLKFVNLPDSIAVIEESAFTGCRRLHLETKTLPKELVSLGAYAFSDCSSLQALILPIGLKKIHGQAFSHSGGAKLFYSGTETNWETVDVEGDYSDQEALDNICLFSKEKPRKSDEDSWKKWHHWRYVDGLPTPWGD